MQKQIFNTGGFVLHGLTGIVHNARISAWFDESGELLDAELLTPYAAKALPKSYIEATAKIKRLGLIHK